MTDLLIFPHKLDRAAHRVCAVVETPAGSEIKFDYDPDSGLFALHSVLPTGMAFPHAFGFVPGTRAEDGDPIDIMILADHALPTGCLAMVTLLGAIEAFQTSQDGKRFRNDRLIGRITESRLYADARDLAALGGALPGELIRFFETYNRLNGKKFEVVAVSDPVRACTLIEQASL